ncbi:hypothetical protein ACFPMF_25395 [Larkinella bovis]|uniref:Lipoprotein n=1 Tax=Larkinella bovis TaxID=683041 RepID=A0ABW0IHB5_9BACT
MRYTCTRFAVLIAALFLNACQTNQQSSEATKPADSTEMTTNRPDSEQDATPSDWLAKLMGPNDGLFRGVKLGDAVSDVKAKEEAEPFEEDADHLGYTIEYENLESVDIQYFLDKNKKVSGIQVDIYLNNRKSVDEHTKELTDYFTRQYGQPAQQSWKIAGKDRVTLTDVSKGKDFGLKLTFGSTPGV